MFKLLSAIVKSLGGKNSNYSISYGIPSLISLYHWWAYGGLDFGRHGGTQCVWSFGRVLIEC